MNFIKKLSASLLFLASLAPATSNASLPGDTLSNLYEGIENRRVKGTNTFSDKIITRSTFTVMHVGSRFIYPEASKVLRQCMRGNGNNININPSYIKNSKVIRDTINDLAGKKDGVYGPFRVYQKQDKRLTYAYNPYHVRIDTLEDGRKRYTVQEWMQFSNPKNKKGHHTIMYMGPLTFKMYDSLVFVASDCKPFWAYATWIE